MWGKKVIGKCVHEKRKNFSMKNHNPNFLNQISYNERTLSFFGSYNFKIAIEVNCTCLGNQDKQNNKKKEKWHYYANWRSFNYDIECLTLVVNRMV